MFDPTNLESHNPMGYEWKAFEYWGLFDLFCWFLFELILPLVIIVLGGIILSIRMLFWCSKFVVKCLRYIGIS